MPSTSNPQLDRLQEIRERILGKIKGLESQKEADPAAVEKYEAHLADVEKEIKSFNTQHGGTQ